MAAVANPLEGQLDALHFVNEWISFGGTRMDKKEQGLCLREYRQRLGYLKLKDFAKELNRRKILESDKPELTVSRWENGHRAPTEATLKKLAKLAKARGYRRVGGESVFELLRKLYNGTIQTREEWAMEFHLHKAESSIFPEGISEAGFPRVTNADQFTVFEMPTGRCRGWGWLLPAGGPPHAPLGAFYVNNDGSIRTILLAKPGTIQFNNTSDLSGPTFDAMAGYIRGLYAGQGDTTRSRRWRGGSSAEPQPLE